MDDKLNVTSKKSSEQQQQSSSSSPPSPVPPLPDQDALSINNGKRLYDSLRSHHKQQQQQRLSMDGNDYDYDDDELMLDAGRKRRISFKNNRRFNTNNNSNNETSNENLNSEERKQEEEDDDDDDDGVTNNIRQVYYNDENESGVGGGGPVGGVAFDSDDQNEDEEEGDKLLFPGYVPVAFKYFDQSRQPRYICLRMITSPWFERASMLVILFNCITLGMYQPCSDTPKCSSTRCILLNYIDHMIHFFFLIEMCIKIMAMGLYGKHTYLAESWNRLDFFIVIAGNLEYVFTTQNLNLAVIRTFRVLRPLRAINRVPSMRILVMLLLDTLPMLGNVLLLCFFVFFIFGIVGVQLWKGVLRNRCYFTFNQTAYGRFIDPAFSLTFYQPEHTDSFVCADAHSNGMTSCAEIPAYVNNSVVCNETMDVLLTHDLATLTRNGQPACINWNHYYTDCRPTPQNPFKGAISFDNIGFAWIAIFQIISLESWVTIMYYIQDAHSFYNWIYFVCLIVIGSFFMINLCLVVIATQFSETKKRETERMIAERRRFSRSTSTLTSGDSSEDREPGSCWEEFIRYLIHLCHKARKRCVSKYKKYQANKKLRRATSKKTAASGVDQTGGATDETFALQTTTSVTVKQQCKCACHSSSQQLRPTARIVDDTATAAATSAVSLNNNISSSNSVVDKTESATSDNNLPSVVVLTPLVVYRCSTCGRKVSNKCEDNNNPVVVGRSDRSGGGGGLNDSSVFYSSIGVPSDPMEVRDEASNHHEFYCYSARETEQCAPVVDGETSDDDDENDDEEEEKQPPRQHRRRRGRAAAASHTNICCYLCCCCCAKQLEPTLCCRVLDYLSKKLRLLVDSSFFQRTILCAILINTISMGIEHHQQPQILTQLVEYSNFFFSCVFMVEMILKILAYGFIEYIKNAFNMFDSIIVCISAYEMVRHFWTSVDGGLNAASSSSGVSVLRTFRLLRILKLVRFMPALRRQLIIMLKTIDNVATFFSLLCLFIFIFSILGMHLFGCKFCDKDASGNRTVADCERKERKNFDSLLWAIITVFQVLTQEDWNEVLYNGMRFTSPWASIYFVLLMTFGNYVLFNLLVAILVEGFSTEDEPKKSLAERIKEDAIQAIQEEAHSKETSQYLYTGPTTNNIGGGTIIGSFDPAETRRTSNSSLPNRTRSVTTRGNRSCSRRSSGLLDTISGRKKSKSLKSVSMRSSNRGGSFRRQGAGGGLSSVSSHLGEWDQRRFRNTSDEGATAAAALTPQEQSIEHDKKTTMPPHPTFQPPPIITHTCPTPTHTPTSSSPSSPRPSSRDDDDACGRSRSNKEIKTCSNQSLTNNIPVRSSRKFSLDSSHDRVRTCDGGGGGDSTLEPRSSKHRHKHHLRHSLGRKRANNTAPIPPKILIDRIDTLQLAKNSGGSTTTTTTTTSNDEVFMSNSIQLNDPASIIQISSSLDDKLLNLPMKRATTKSRGEQVSEIVAAAAGAEEGDQVVVRSKGASKSIVLKKSELYTVDIQNEPPKTDERGEQVKSKRKRAAGQEQQNADSIDLKLCFNLPKSPECLNNKTDYALYLFPIDNPFRQLCVYITSQRWFDYSILFFIALNCITLAMERPSITPNSLERKLLTNSNYFFTVIFMAEMVVKIVANGFYIGQNAYLNSGWNKMDCFLVAISLIDAIVSLTAKNSPKIFGILRVFRLLRTLKPLRVISRAPGLKLVVQTLLTSLRPIGNIVLICCTFFIIFGILGVQLFKGKFYRCVGSDLSQVKTKEDCLANPHNQWINSQYNFDNLGQALMALFVLASKDGWVQIMYYGIDAVGVDKQPVDNYNEWMLLYFISFLLLVGFFVLNMFVGVVIENFHKCRAEQEKEEKARRAAKRAKKFEEKRRKMKEIPYYANYSPVRRFLHSICNSKYFDLIIAGVIGLNVVTMSLEFYKMPAALDETLDIFNYIFTSIFLIEAILRMVALGFVRYIREKWNQLDILIVILSIAGIFFDKINTRAIPINPTIIRVMRVLRIARVLKLLKMAKGIRSLLDTVIQALPQVGNLGLLFFLLFFIFAILGVELFGKLNCDSVVRGCDGLSKHAHFHNFGMAFLTLFRIATGDNWNGIMKDTLKDNVLCQDDSTTWSSAAAAHGQTNSSICLAAVLAPIYFVIFVLMAQFVLVNVVVAVLMKHLDESNKMQADDAEMDEEIEKQLENEARNNLFTDDRLYFEDDTQNCERTQHQYQMRKVNSLPPNYTFETSPETKIKTMNELIKHSSVPFQANNYLAHHHHNHQRQSKSNGSFFIPDEATVVTTTTAGGRAKEKANILKRLLGHTTSSRMNSSSASSSIAAAAAAARQSSNNKRSSKLLVERDLDYISKGLNAGPGPEANRKVNKLFSPSEIMPKYSYTSEYEPTSTNQADDDNDEYEEKMSYVSINNEIDTHSAILKSSKNRRRQQQQQQKEQQEAASESLLARAATPFVKQQQYQKQSSSSSSNNVRRLSVTPDSSEVIRCCYSEQDESFRFDTKSHFSPASSLRIRVIDDAAADVNDL